MDLTPWLPFPWLRQEEAADAGHTCQAAPESVRSHIPGPLFSHESGFLKAGACGVCDSLACGRSSGSVAGPPWEGLSWPAALDDALQELIDLTLKTYVHEWCDLAYPSSGMIGRGVVSLRYLGEISSDPSFLQELRYQIRWLAASLLRRLTASDLLKGGLADWLLTKAALFTAHLHA